MKRTPLRKVGKKAQRERPAFDQARADLLLRSGGRCEGRDFSPHCTGVGTDAHHVRIADRDEGRHEADRMLFLCRACHQEAHANPRLARHAGLIVSSWEEPRVGPA